jgi:hypothetical protein
MKADPELGTRVWIGCKLIGPGFNGRLLRTRQRSFDSVRGEEHVDKTRDSVTVKEDLLDCEVSALRMVLE